MSMIDWSDPDEMVGLLADYIRDELQEETADHSRRSFLRQLAGEIESLARLGDLTAEEAEHRLREICDAQPSEYASDAVIVHLQDCIVELRRIATEATSE